MAVISICVLVPAYIIMITAWPWAILNPLSGPYLALLETTQFRYNDDVLLMGDYVKSNAFRRSYLPAYFGVRLPEYFLLVLIFVLPYAFLNTYRALINGDRKRFFGYAILWLGIFFPPLYAIALKSVHYDGIRHFLFIIPPLAVLAGTEIARIDAWLYPKRLVMLAIASILVFSGILYTGWAMFRLHPYQYVYYNALTGSTGGAVGRFEMDYWGISYKEAIYKLVRYANEDAEKRGLSHEDRQYRVLICGPSRAAAYFLPEAFHLVEDVGAEEFDPQVDQADFYVSHTRLDCDKEISAPIVATVERLGARLSVVKDLRFNGRSER